MRIIMLAAATAALLLGAGGAHAQGCVGIACQGQQQRQGQAQGQIQGQQQRQAAIGVGLGVGISAGNTTTANQTVKIGKPAYAPSVVLTSSNCIGSVSASGGGGGIISLGFGTTLTYDDCFKMEAAKVYLAMGEREKANALLQSISYVRAATGTATLRQTGQNGSLHPAGTKVATGCYKYSPANPYPAKGQATC